MMKSTNIYSRLVMALLGVFFVFICNTTQGNATEGDRSDAPRNKWGSFALLVIDIQNYFWNDQLSGEFPDFPKNISKLLNFCRSEGIDIIHLRARFKPDMSDWPSYFKLRGKIPCVKGTEGEKVLPFAKEAPGEKIIYKHSFDGFLNTELSDYLKENNKKYLFIAGMDTGVCVISTCFSAFQKGYLLTLLEDCCAGEIHAHRFITQSYNGFVFESDSFKNIETNYPRWIEMLNQLDSIEKKMKE